MSSTTPNARKPLVLDKGVKPALDNSTLTRSKRGQQVHAIVDGEARTLCAIDPTTWNERVDGEDKLVTCPICAERQKERVAAAKAEAKAAAKDAKSDEVGADAAAAKDGGESS
jgi:hypothetical protein